jgi:hypothetical protein
MRRHKTRHAAPSSPSQCLVVAWEVWLNCRTGMTGDGSRRGGGDGGVDGAGAAASSIVVILARR